MGRLMVKLEGYFAAAFVVLLAVLVYVVDHALLSTEQVLALTGIDLLFAALAVTFFYLTADKP